jgi:transcriptional regulator with XRE-family HTH domain
MASRSDKDNYVGEMIRRCRLWRGYTQEEAKELANDAGFNLKVDTLGSYERGNSEITFIKTLKLLEVYNFSLERALGMMDEQY